MTPEERRKSNLKAVKAWQSRNPEKVKASAARRNAQRSEEKRLEGNKRQRLWYKANAVACRAREKKRRKENKLVVLEQVRKWWKKRYYSDAQFRLLSLLRNRINKALRGNSKSQTTVALLGCPVVWLEVHLESLFRAGMTWENYGPVWEVDHIKPCAAFDLSLPDHQKACFHWTNLQPLFTGENRKKGANTAQ